MWLIKSWTCYKLMYFINVDCKWGLSPTQWLSAIRNSKLPSWKVFPFKAIKPAKFGSNIYYL